MSTVNFIDLFLSFFFCLLCFFGRLDFQFHKMTISSSIESSPSLVYIVVYTHTHETSAAFASLFVVYTVYHVTTVIAATTTVVRAVFVRCDGTGGHGQRGAVGGADHVHSAGADVGRLPVLPAAVGLQPPRSVPTGRRRRRRHGRRGRRGRWLQPAPPSPSAPPSAPPSRAAATVAPVAQPHAVLGPTRLRRTGRTVRQRGQRVTSTVPVEYGRHTTTTIAATTTNTITAANITVTITTTAVTATTTTRCCHANRR